MTLNGWLQIAVFALLILAVTKPLGVFMARVFAGEGMRIVLADVEAPALAAAAAQLEHAGAEVLAIELDVSDRAALEDAARRVEARFGHVPDALDLAFFLENQRAPAVGHLDHRQWLDEQRCTAGRLIVDDAGHLPA